MQQDRHQVFLSYASEDQCEASLLQFAVEQLLHDALVDVWTYSRNQSSSERQIGRALKDEIRSSAATVFLASPTTFSSGATQWMELAYADAFQIPTYVLLHHLSVDDLRSRNDGVPPFLFEGQCTQSVDWRKIVEELRNALQVTEP